MSGKRTKPKENPDVKLRDAIMEARAPGNLVAEALADAAYRGIYSDFHSPLPFPKMALVRDLEAAGLFTLATRAKSGEFDG